MATTRVTVIDDSPDLLVLLAEVLQMRGMTVTTMSSAPSVLELEESEPDLLLVDLRMGGSADAGWDLIRTTRDHPRLRACPLIAFTTSRLDIDQHEAELHRLPHTFLLWKPFSLRELEAAVDAALGLANGGRSRPPR